MVEQLKVLFLSPEAVPFAKRRIADVAGGLPGALKHLGVNIRTVMPLYDMVRKSNTRLKLLIDDLKVPLAGKSSPPVCGKQRVLEKFPHIFWSRMTCLRGLTFRR